ncbi:prepilin-type N-terminal cleavage/methylation domain-containing protein [Candidatus Nomurabacteria bacterium]|jgi:prepilin-type N-terminal cleavage/methylation domain-containing protein|nr:prepilin-type N-terminal cleavage/methylation domain-containing protein [Candidatus Saccharibacteria bacterium]MCA9350549.1 prepilin-type N-terminal cleavage/methylation domain-containing protein [Candidatus Saccharibacteria bacterium]MCB9839405.1 prepilin-type N-terminal cleavage/methylation domain-containing protein [Candidatus Nomurabacteria bacterium]
MTSQKTKQAGFTIVELLIVIVIIGILAAIGFVSYSNATKKARDTERASDVKAISAKAEEYYASDPTNAGSYPADCGVLQGLNGLTADTFHAPKGAAGSNCATTAPSATSDVYQYTTSTTIGQPKFTITYWSESKGATENYVSTEKN